MPNRNLFLSSVLIFVLLIISFSHSVKGTSQMWNQTYGGELDDEANSIVETDDGRYAIADETNSFGASGSDCRLIKVGYNGNVQLTNFKYSPALGTAMKNSECTIYIMFKDRWIQKFKKGKDGWKLTTTKGTVYPCSAEQLLSHILPAIAGTKGQNVTVKVKPDQKIET